MRGKLNTNVEVYDNEFSFTRDNVLEPEYDATNWWFFNDRSATPMPGSRSTGSTAAAGISTTTSAGSTTSRAANAPSMASASGGRNGVPPCAPTCTTAGASSSSGPTGAMRRVRSTSSTTLVSAGQPHQGRRLGYLVGLGQRHRLLPARGLSRRPLRGLEAFFNGFLWDSDNYPFNHDLAIIGISRGIARPGLSRQRNLRVAVAAVVLRRRPWRFLAGRGQRGAGSRLVVDEDERGLLGSRDPLPPVRGPDIGAPAAGAAGPAVDFLFYDGSCYRNRRASCAPTCEPESTATDEGARLRIVFSTPIRLMASDLRVDFDYGDAAPSLSSDACQYSGRTLTCPISAVLPTAPLRRVLVPGHHGRPNRPAGDDLGQRVGCNRTGAVTPRKAGFCKPRDARTSHFPALRTKSGAWRLARGDAR